MRRSQRAFKRSVRGVLLPSQRERRRSSQANRRKTIGTARSSPNFQVSSRLGRELLAGRCARSVAQPRTSYLHTVHRVALWDLPDSLSCEAVERSASIARSVSFRRSAASSRAEGHGRVCCSSRPMVVALACLRPAGRAVRPNPSLERTPTGKALGPRGGQCHHPPRGPSAFPAGAAQLKR
jgi:hypothetical protein